MRIQLRQLGCLRLLLIALICIASTVLAHAEAPLDQLVRDQYGAIIRGNVKEKKLALVFTGDAFGESTQPILDTLKQRNIKAGLFVTGNFVRNKNLRPLLERAIAEGHYVGPHSDSHPLYAAWDDRNKSFVTEAFFTADLRKNIKALQSLGALRKSQRVLFIPPYEYFNRDQLRWSKKMGVTLINFTPGSGSNRDYAREDDPHFASSQKILDDILTYEQKDSHSLNGFILLTHLGSGRRDPFQTKLTPLCDELTKRGYQFERIDQLLQ